MYKYWDYYLTIERDIIETTRFVEFVPTNYSCYSIEFARIIMSAGTELDMVFKQLCEKIDPNTTADNINNYYDVVIPVFPNIINIQRYIRGYELLLKPFDGWTKGNNPCWWTHGYNKIKHERNTYFNKATLENAINIVSGLSIVLFLFYKLEYGENLPFGIKNAPKLIVPYVSSEPEQDGFNYIMNMEL
jgi:hypothetical protein